MDLTRTLKKLLIAQLLMFGWAMQTMYSSSHDGVSDFSGLGAMLPLGAFALLGIVNLALFIIYLYEVINNELCLDVLVLNLVVYNILLVILGKYLVGWALSGSG